MHASTLAAYVAAATPAADAPSLFKIDSVTAFASVVFGLVCILVSVYMAWRAKKAKVSENGQILGNLGLAAVAFVIGSGALAIPFAKSIIGFFTNTNV